MLRIDARYTLFLAFVVSLLGDTCAPFQPRRRFLHREIACTAKQLGSMPPSKAAAAKKQRLTLAQLSAYDDILTDALVDHVSGL